MTGVTSGTYPKGWEAQWLAVSEATINRMLRREVLPRIKIGVATRIRAEATPDIFPAQDRQDPPRLLQHAGGTVDTRLTDDPVSERPTVPRRHRTPLGLRVRDRSGCGEY